MKSWYVFLLVGMIAAAAAGGVSAQTYLITHEDYHDPYFLPQPGGRWAAASPAVGQLPSSLVSGYSESTGAGTYDRSTLYEMRRLLGIRAGENTPDLNQLKFKALLALPLMKRGNEGEILCRPQSEIYNTFAKRLALRRLDKLGRIDIPPGMVAVDTHVHTCYSHDSLSGVGQMLAAAGRCGLSGVAITDHDTVDGAIKAQSVAQRMILKGELPPTFFVITGEEVSSKQGHIIALYITQGIPTGISAADTVAAIHKQGGLAIAAHPELSDGVGELAKTLPFDGVETANAAEEMHFAMGSEQAEAKRDEFYDDVTKPHMGASDAHDPAAVGVCYTLLKCAPNLQAVRTALVAGDTTPVARLTEQEQRKLVRQKLPRAAFVVGAIFGTGWNGISDWIRKATHADVAGISLWPSPGLIWTKRI